MFGDLGVIVSDGVRVQCHVCGRWYKGVGSHAVKAHDMSADDYRAKFGLRYTTSLLGEESTAKLSRALVAAMDVNRLAAIRSTVTDRFGKGRKRRLESKIDPNYQDAQAKAFAAMREGYERAKQDGLLPRPDATRLNTSDARAKARATRMSDPDKVAARNRQISEQLKSYYALHPAPPKPPVSDETRRKMSEAAKRRGVKRETVEDTCKE